MGGYIKKPWGWMKRVVLPYGGKSKCWLGFMDYGSATSIHRHSCDSVISCVSGEFVVNHYGDGESPDIDNPYKSWIACGESVEVSGNVWHSVSSIGTDREISPYTIFHEWYDLKDDGSDYPIERYEGAAS